MQGPLAFGDGSPLGGSLVKRQYRLVDGGLEVSEQLIRPGGARGLAYRVPRAAQILDQSPERVSFRLG